MNALTLDLTRDYIDLRIAQHFEFYLSTKVLFFIVVVVAVLRTRKVVNDRLAQRKADTYTAPPLTDFWNDQPTFDDFA